MNRILGYSTFGLIFVCLIYAFKPQSNVKIQEEPKITAEGGTKSQEDLFHSNKPIENNRTLRLEYIKRYAKIAQEEQGKYGVPASITLAQGILESASGTSTLAEDNNNHFGIKCFKRNCAKGHCSNFTDDSHKDFFRKYPSAWESFRAHSIMLANGHYKVLLKYKDSKKWAKGLKKLGYATDKEYDNTLIEIIDEYKLQRFDK